MILNAILTFQPIMISKKGTPQVCVFIDRLPAYTPSLDPQARPLQHFIIIAAKPAKMPTPHRIAPDRE